MAEIGGLLSRAMTAFAAAIWMTVAGGLPAYAEKDCAAYAALAVTQSGQYGAMDCRNGLPEWWRVDEAYHRIWCEKDSTTEAMVTAGTDSRATALNDCRETPSLRGSGADVAVGAEGVVMRDRDIAALATGAVAGTTVKSGGGGTGTLSPDGAVLILGGGEIRLPCPLQFGDVSFRPEEVEGGISIDGHGSNGMTAQCAYRGGEMRIIAKWAMPYPAETPPPAGPVQLGCWQEHMGAQERATETGFQSISETFAAQASANGSGALALIARDHAAPAVRDMLIIAELHGPISCP